ncbi:MAG: Vitamin B12 transporter BtuB [Gammaproteobacteria bacterium]|nr:Vitamin B12 transporter BtuB [Gammaproteobacteria bacterium]
MRAAANYRWIPLICAGALLAAARPAGSQEVDSQPYELGEIVVSGAQPVVEQAGSVRELSSEDVARRGARTLDEAIELEPGVNVSTRADGTPRIDVRGRRTRHVKLLINGVPFNNAADGQFDPTLIPTEQIARVKITSGLQSQLYGDNGLGAVINIVTKQAVEGKHANLLTEVGNGNERRVVATFTGANKEFGLLVSAGHQERDGYDLSEEFRATLLEGGGLRENSDRRRETLYANATYTPSNDLEFGLTFNFADGDHGVPSSVFDDTEDPFVNPPRNERVDEERAYYAQVSADYSPEGPWSHRGWAYVSQFNEVTNRYTDGTLTTYNDPTVYGTFSNDADSLIIGAHAQSEYRDPWGGTLSFMVEGREERLAEDCAVRDVPRLVAPVAPAPGPAPAPTTATIDYTYTTTNLAGDTTAAGTNAPVARLVMTDRPGGGVDFTLTNLAGENFGSNDYLSRLFLSVDPSVDTSTWGFSNAASSEASIGGVTFGSNTEVVDGYLYPIRVNFQRPGGAGGTADPLLEGDSARFLFSEGSVADLVSTPISRTGGGAPDMYSAIGFRGADAAGFWGVSSIDITGQGAVPRVNVQAPAVALGGGGEPPFTPSPPTAASCEGGGGGGDDATPVGPIPGFVFDVRNLEQENAIHVVSAATEYGIEPVPGWGGTLGVGHHWLLREEEEASGAFTFGAGAYHDLSDATRIRANVSRKVRPPSVSQLYSFRGGNPDLEFERTLGYEIGLRQHIGPRLTANIVGFHDDVSNLIQRDRATGLQENFEEVRFRGVEFTADATPIDHLALQFNYSLVDSLDLSPDTVREEIQNVPGDTVSVNASYDCCSGWSASLSWLYVSEEFFYARGGSPLKAERDPYALLNLKLERTLFSDHAALFVGADNVLDVDYEESYGFPQAGRFIFGGMKIRL